VGIGDDAAVVSNPGPTLDLVYTTDAVVESVHFLPGTDPRLVGRKMAGRLLSDLAAMGAEPRHMLFNLVSPPGYRAADMKAIYEGADALASAHGAAIIGGDTMCARPLALHGFATGVVPAGRAVLRSGAKTGDRIYVTGELGGSINGKHLDFEPRVPEGIWLREGGWPHAMMDISDGVARDLPRLCCASGVGAVLRERSIPVSPAAASWHAALCDGEDYELLFTVDASRASEFETAWRSFSKLRCTCIGEMSGAPDQILIMHADGKRAAFSPSGFDHLGG
jgi:thiamine-monophosphate kinase